MGLLNEGLFFIDDRGKSVIATAKRDRERQIMASDEEILREAVERAGWIAVHADPARSAVQVRFCVRNVREAAITAAGAILLRHPFRDVVLCYKTGAWRTERLGGGLEAATRFLTVLEKADEELASERFRPRITECDGILKERDDTRARGCASILQAWRERGGQYFDGLPHMLEHLELIDAAWVVDLSYEEPEGVFRHVGKEFDILLESLKKEVAGRPLMTHPDPHYGRWLSSGCRELASREEAQSLEVTFDEPLLATQSYAALRLPWKLEDDSDRVTALRFSVERTPLAQESLRVA